MSQINLYVTLNVNKQIRKGLGDLSLLSGWKHRRQYQHAVYYYVLSLVLVWAIDTIL